MLTPGWSNELRLCVVPPIPADQTALTMYHDKDYVDFILEPHKSSDQSEDSRCAEFGIEEVRNCLPKTLSNVLIGLPGFP